MAFVESNQKFIGYDYDYDHMSLDSKHRSLDSKLAKFNLYNLIKTKKTQLFANNCKNFITNLNSITSKKNILKTEITREQKTKVKTSMVILDGDFRELYKDKKFTEKINVKDLPSQQPTTKLEIAKYILEFYKIYITNLINLVELKEAISDEDISEATNSLEKRLEIQFILDRGSLSINNAEFNIGGYRKRRKVSRKKSKKNSKKHTSKKGNRRVSKKKSKGKKNKRKVKRRSRNNNNRNHGNH
jgi:hypothetical protein